MKCPITISNSLFEIQSKVKRLVHDSENNYQSYKYVSVDAYYEFIRPLLNDAGLMIIPNEEDAGLSPDGKTLKVVLAFTMLHKDGDVWEFPIRRTVYLPYTGAQSCGSALSYADKFIMRTLFKIPTGEYEAEADEKTSHDADSLQKVRGGQDTTIDFDYSGQPYRIFNGNGSVSQTFNEIRAWGMKIKASNDLGNSNNIQEIERIKRDVNDDMQLTEKEKEAFMNSLNSLGGAI